jgi:hypothetical protein
MKLCSADSKEEVNNWENEVKKVGGIIISNAEEFGKGYYALFLQTPMGVSSMYSICKVLDMKELQTALR